MERARYPRAATEQTTAVGPADTFGARHQLVFSSDSSLSIHNSSQSGVDGSTTTISLAPSVDYFVAPNFSVGGTVSWDYSTTSTGTVTGTAGNVSGSAHSSRFGIGPRLGYNVAFSDYIGLWPKLGISYTNTSGTAPSNNAVALNVFVPIMFHPAKHFFVGFGPYVDTDLSGDFKTTDFGGKLTLGGWVMP